MRETGACRIIWSCLSAGHHLFFQHILSLSESKTSKAHGWKHRCPLTSLELCRMVQLLFHHCSNQTWEPAHRNLRPLARWNKDVVSQNVSGCGVEFIQEHEMGTWGSAQALLEDIRERHLAGGSCVNNDLAMKINDPP